MVPPKLQDTITQSINTGEKAKAYQELKTLSEEESKELLMEENEERLKVAEKEAVTSESKSVGNGGSRPKKTRKCCKKRIRKSYRVRKNKIL
jgi:hypothetical protein